MFRMYKLPLGAESLEIHTNEFTQGKVLTYKVKGVNYYKEVLNGHQHHNIEVAAILNSKLEIQHLNLRGKMEEINRLHAFIEDAKKDSVYSPVVVVLNQWN